MGKQNKYDLAENLAYTKRPGKFTVGREGLAYCSVLYPTQSHDLSANLPTVPVVAGKLSRIFFLFVCFFGGEEGRDGGKQDW